jgi:hypothetical protein
METVKSGQHDLHKIVIVVVADGHVANRDDGIQGSEQLLVFFPGQPMGDLIEAVGIDASH